MQSKSHTRSKRVSKLAIFDTFKTRQNKFTGEAKRQREIIAHLAVEASPELKTRTAIAHAIAGKNGIPWQNIYSGIFRDLDEVLVPSQIVRGAGRLPLKRGPKVLQQQGVPYYELTDAGLIVASSLEEVGDSRTKLLEGYLNRMDAPDPELETLKEGMLLLLRLAPSFVFKIVREYVLSYTQGTLDELLPLQPAKMRSVIADKISVERQLVEAFSILADDKRSLAGRFFGIIG